MPSRLLYSWRSRRRLWSVGLLCFGLIIIALATTRARLPKPETLIGVWLGFDEDELNFTRLDLRPDFTGFCARVSPADTILHEYGVEAYRVTKWNTDGWKLVISRAQPFQG